MKGKNKKYSIIIIITLVAGLLIGGNASGVYGAINASNNVVKTDTVQAKAINNSAPVSQDKGSASKKDETVYIIADANGQTNKIIVSDWLQNAESLSNIVDSTALEDVHNVKGEETFTDEGASKVWTANGKDIYYQGTIQKDLPISMKIKYSLDGKEISPAELEGKSGRVTISFEYQNNLTKSIKLNNKTENVNVPFVVASGMVLDNDIFTNVQIDNGKILNDGDKTVVMGFALPGLRDSLKLKGDDVSIPEQVEITADVVGFEVPATMTVVTNDLFNQIKIGDTSDLDVMKASISKLSEASNTIYNGTEDLYSGLSTLLVKSKELNNGAKSLAAGANTLYAGIGSVNKGAADLENGIEAVNTGLGTLVKNNDSLNEGASSVFQSLLAMANEQLKGAGVEAPALTIENYQAVLGQILDTLDKKQAAVAGNNEMTAQIEKSKYAINSLKAQLDSYSSFYKGVQEYTAGVSQASQGTNKLIIGAKQLSEGTAKVAFGTKNLLDGINTLSQGTNALVDGVDKLNSGSLELRDGMKRFNEEGIQKLVNAFDGDIDELIERINEISKLSKEYNNFAGIGEGVDGSVKFIYKTE